MKSMTKYEWSEEFYNEIIKDHNYRFPKLWKLVTPNMVRRITTND